MTEDGCDTLGLSSLDATSTIFLVRLSHRTELVTQWTKITIINSMSTGKLSVPAPILTRFCYEIDLCVAKCGEGRSCHHHLFPYVVTLQAILTVHGFIAPIAIDTPLRFQPSGCAHHCDSHLCALEWTLWISFDCGASDIDLKLL